MRAMILAAGLGTRLRPLTDARPKALVEVAGRTLLEITLARLREFGVREVIVNVHHFSQMIVDYLKDNHHFNMDIEISREDDLLLDTGGGLKKAAPFFLKHSQPSDPFLLHNVDVISDIDLHQVVESHVASKALVTLAVQERKTSRYLLFDEQLELCGRRAGADRQPQMVRPAHQTHSLAFTGIHVISTRFLEMITEEGAFSIVPVYLRVAAAGEKILGYRADQSYWRDLGKPESVAKVDQELRQKPLA